MSGPPRLVWSAWKEFGSRLARAPRVAVFSDFDGTLAPIVRHPGAARLPAGTRRALNRLRRRPRARVGVVSGRSLADLQRRVGLRGIYYVGSHGLEWAGPDGRHQARVNAGFRTRIRYLGKELRAQLARLPGIYVEPKTVSVAVHYRNASSRVAGQARRLMRRVANASAKSLRLLEGKKVVELLPPGKMDKGLAVMKLAARMGRRRPLLVYLGDDVTDESVFRRLGRDDLGVHIGAGTSSQARYRLRSPAEGARFLERVREVLD